MDWFMNSPNLRKWDSGSECILSTALSIV